MRTPVRSRSSAARASDSLVSRSTSSASRVDAAARRRRCGPPLADAPSRRRSTAAPMRPGRQRVPRRPCRTSPGARRAALPPPPVPGCRRGRRRVDSSWPRVGFAVRDPLDEFCLARRRGREGGRRASPPLADARSRRRSAVAPTRRARQRVPSRPCRISSEARRAAPRRPPVPRRAAGRHPAAQYRRRTAAARDPSLGPFPERADLRAPPDARGRR